VRAAAALAALLGAVACEPGLDPRIVASFRQGGSGAYYYYASPTVASGRVYIGTSRKLLDEPARPQLPRDARRRRRGERVLRHQGGRPERVLRDRGGRKAPLGEPIGADLYSSPALGDDRTVYVGSESTGAAGLRFHALDMATGARRWSVSIRGGDVTWSSPALVDGGLVYVGSMDGAVYAIRSDATRLLPDAGSPRFRGGNDGTGRHE
jgi:hypothetical protein